MPDFEQMLREAALRVTRPRLAVLYAVHDRPHADTNSIIRVVRDRMDTSIAGNGWRSGKGIRIAVPGHFG